MKTPREILLGRHQAAAPKLDKLRQETLNTEFNHGNSRIALLNWPALLWRELIWPCRRFWTGLAAVWVLIVAANISMRDNSQTVVAKSTSPQEIIMAWRQQQSLLTELIGPNETHAVLPSRRFSPRPSSQRLFETLAT